MSSFARGTVVGTGMADNDMIFAQVGAVAETRHACSTGVRLGKP